MKILLFIIAMAVICVLIGLPVMLLWNACMPQIFGLPVITFAQAVWLTLLLRCILPGTNITTKE